MDKLIIDVSEADRKVLRKKELQISKPSFLVVCGCLIALLLIQLPISWTDEGKLIMGDATVYEKVLGVASFFTLCFLLLLWFGTRFLFMKAQRRNLSDKTILVASDEAIRVNQISEKNRTFVKSSS